MDNVCLVIKGCGPSLRCNHIDSGSSDMYLCLSQIKSGHTGDAIHPRSDGKECIQRAERGAVPAHPCSTIDAYVPHCSIASTTTGRDEDVVRLTR